MRMIDRITTVEAQVVVPISGVFCKLNSIFTLNAGFRLPLSWRPVMPGCLGLDAPVAGARLFLAWRGHIGKVGHWVWARSSFR